MNRDISTNCLATLVVAWWMGILEEFGGDQSKGVSKFNPLWHA